MLQTRHCIVQYVVEIAAAALVAQVVCHKHTSEPASLSAYSCCNKWPHVFVYQFLVVWIDKTLQPRIHIQVLQHRNINAVNAYFLRFAKVYAFS